MKFLLAAVIVLCVSISVSSQNQELLKAEAVTFHISSLNTPFGVQGDFAGEYRIYPTWIELKITKANLYDSEHCPYQGRRLITALKFGLGSNTEGKSWKIEHLTEGLSLERIMRPKDVVELGEFYVLIPKEEALDLSKRWVVVQIEETAVDYPVEKEQKGYAFAHSCHDIFSGK